MDDVKALFGLIDKKNKRRLLGAVICCVLSVLCGILPYLGVWGIVTCFLNERTENLFQYVCLIAAAIILKHLLFGTGTKISHKVAYQTLGETRKKLFRKIARLPMGYVKTTASGQVKTIISNGVQREHNKKLNNGLPILHKVPPKRDYGRYFCIMAEKGGTSHGGLTEKLSPFFHAKKQEVNAYGR